MNAEEARRIWEREVTLKAQSFVDYIEKKILQYTYQENAFFYVFEFPDFLKTIRAIEQEEVTEEFIQGIFDKITSYFKDLGFKVKADKEKHKIWITYMQKRNLKKNSFTDNLINLISVRRNQRTFTGVDGIVNDILSQIREKARRGRQIKYPLILNIPNEKSLLLEDLLDIITILEEAGFQISLKGLASNNDCQTIGENIEKAIEEGMCFEKLVVDLTISW